MRNEENTGFKFPMRTIENEAIMILLWILLWILHVPAPMKTNTMIALPNQKQTVSPKARDGKCIHASPKTTIKPCMAQRINKNNTDGSQIRKQTNPLSIPTPCP